MASDHQDNKEKTEREVVGFVGVGLDNKDGHKRLTQTDIGGGVTQWLGALYPGEVVGIHITSALIGAGGLGGGVVPTSRASRSVPGQAGDCRRGTAGGRTGR